MLNAGLLKKTFSVVLRYTVGIALLYWLARTDTINLSAFSKLNATVITQGVALMMLQMALSTLRVQALLRDQKIVIGYWQCFAYNCVGLFYSLFLPGGISGDAMRAYYFCQSIEKGRAAMIGSLLLDRFLGLLAMIGLGVMAGTILVFFVSWLAPYVLMFAAIFLVMVLALVFVLRYEMQHQDTGSEYLVLRLFNRVRSMLGRLNLTAYSVRTLSETLSLSILIHLTAIWLIYICSVLNNADLDFLQVAAVAPIGLLANAIPISPGGLGVGEKGFDLLYSAIGGGNGASTFLMARFFLYLPAIVGAVVALILLVRLHKLSVARAAFGEKSDSGF